MPYDVALARAVAKIPEPGALEGSCRYEARWDGYRALADLSDAGAHVRSRQGTDLSATFPEITAAIRAQLEPVAD